MLWMPTHKREDKFQLITGTKYTSAAVTFTWTCSQFCSRLLFSSCIEPRLAATNTTSFALPHNNCTAYRNQIFNHTQGSYHWPCHRSTIRFALAGVFFFRRERNSNQRMEVTKEEVVEIVTGFLLNSPPGEFAEVVTVVWFYLSSPLLSCLFILYISPFHPLTFSPHLFGGSSVCVLTHPSPLSKMCGAYCPMSPLSMNLPLLPVVSTTPSKCFKSSRLVETIRSWLPNKEKLVMGSTLIPVATKSFPSIIWDRCDPCLVLMKKKYLTPAFFF